MNEKLKKGLIIGSILSVILNVGLICAIIYVGTGASKSQQLVKQLQEQLTTLNGEITTSINISGAIDQGNSQLGTAIDNSKAIVGQISSENKKLGELIDGSQKITSDLDSDNRGLTKSIDSSRDNCRTAKDRNTEAQRLITECIGILKQSETNK